MKTQNFTYTIKTPKSSDEVFKLLLNVRQWWSGLFEESFKGTSEKKGDEFTFKAGGGVHETTQKLVELVPGKRVVWEVTQSNLTFLSDPTEWKGTKISFDLVSTGKGTEVTFTHEGLVPEVECYEDCSAGWTGYLDKLKETLK